MAICVDMTLYCDRCNGNDVMESSVAKIRQEAKKHGYIRKKNADGIMQDICSDCKKKVGGR